MVRAWQIDGLINAARSYGALHGIRMSTVSKRLFNDGKVLARTRARLRHHHEAPQRCHGDPYQAPGGGLRLSASQRDRRGSLRARFATGVLTYVADAGRSEGPNQRHQFVR